MNSFSYIIFYICYDFLCSSSTIGFIGSIIFTSSLVLCFLSFISLWFSILTFLVLVHLEVQSTFLGDNGTSGSTLEGFYLYIWKYTGSCFLLFNCFLFFSLISSLFLCYESHSFFISSCSFSTSSQASFVQVFT